MRCSRILIGAMRLIALQTQPVTKSPTLQVKLPVTCFFGTSEQTDVRLGLVRILSLHC